MELQARSVEFSDLVAFVDREVGIITNPVFGKLSESSKPSSCSETSAASVKTSKSREILSQVEGAEDCHTLEDCRTSMFRGTALKGKLAKLQTVQESCAVNGPLGRHCHRSQSSSFFVKVDPQLQQMVEEFYNRDFTGSIDDDRTEMPQNERRFMKNAEETVEPRDGHYQISLPFKDRVALVPNNKSQALRRANRLKKKLERDPELCADYKAFMGDIVAKGYARKSDES